MQNIVDLKRIALKLELADLVFRKIDIITGALDFDGCDGTYEVEQELKALVKKLTELS